MAPTLERGSLVLAFLFTAIACARIVSTYSELSLTSDEPAHFACGLEYLSQHIFKLEPQHPPLARAMAALGPYLEGLRPAAGEDFTDVGYKTLEQAGNVPHSVTRMRWGILPFFVLGCAVVYVWTGRQYGKAAAALAVAIFTLQPVVLAHAGLATTDMALAACLGAAFVALMAWAERPNWLRCVLLGVTSAMAVLSKFSALGYLPACGAAALGLYAWVRRPGWPELLALGRRRAPTFTAAIGITAFLIWAAYWFSYGTVPGWSIRVPAPEFFDGVRFAARHSASGHPGYLLGEYSVRGWWYFFPIALAVKTPIATLLVAAIGTMVCWRRVGMFGLGPAAFTLGILIPAMTSHVNIGTRHVLPVYMSFSVLGALGVVQLGRVFGRPAAIGVPALLLAWMAVSGALQHPDYLAYFNEFAGGEPDRILVDSDLDWGQEVVRLSRRLRELHAPGLSASFLQASRYLNFYQKAYGLPPIEAFQPVVPNAGWNAVSPTVLRENGGAGQSDRSLAVNTGAIAIRGPWYERVPPTEKAGALLLYNIPRGFVPQ